MTPIWWLLGFIPALLILYFLKLKRQELVISSTMLWMRSLEDLHVNSPFQKLRRSLLFLLQFAILLLLIFAIWRPRCDSVALGGRNLIVFMDNSASMNAKEDGGSRLALARKEALKLVGQLSSTDRMMLLTFAERTTTVQPMTSDRALLEKQIASIRPSSFPTDLAVALTNAHSLSQSLPAAEIYVIGDGCYEELSDLSPEVKRLKFEFLGRATDLENVAITAADVRRSFERQARTEIFAQVRSHLKTEREIVVSLSHEGQIVDAKSVTVAPGAGKPLVFDVSGLAAGIVTLEIDVDDALEDDNRVFLEISPPRDISALIVGEANEWIDFAFRSVTRFKARRVSRAAFSGPEIQALLASVDPPVVVFDRWVPEVIPDVPAIFIARTPPLPPGVESPRREERLSIIDWDSTHAVHRDIVFSNILMKESFVFGEGADELFRPLAESEKGPVIGILNRKTARGIVPAIWIGFDILESNWPLGHYSFPIFFSNALEWLGARFGDSVTRIPTGQSIAYQLQEEVDGEESKSVEFRSPDGSIQEAALERGGTAVFGLTAQVGVYDLLVDSRVVQRFGVCLLNEKESDLTPKKTIDFGDYERVAQGQLVDQNREFWMWLAIAALAVMLLEWYVYHRRVYV